MNRNLPHLESSSSTRKYADVTIVKLSKKGNGIGYATQEQGSKIVEVPFAIPGDTVKTHLSRKRGGIYNGFLQEITHPSQDRTSPRCMHFGYCGGCRWQQVSYSLQLTWKEAAIRQHLAPYLDGDSLFHPIVPCEPSWQYRNKMEFSFSSNRAKEHFLGLVIDSSNGKVLNLQECHLVNSWFITALQAVKQWWDNTELDAYHPHHNTGTLRTLTVREGVRTGDRLVMLTVSGNPDYALNKGDLMRFVQAVRNAVEPEEGSGKLTIFLRIHQIIPKKKTQFYEMLLYGPDHIVEKLYIDIDGSGNAEEMSFMVSPSAFFQPNTRQAERVYTLALQMAQLPSEATVYDLYCGTGVLGMCAAKKAKEVIGIELSAESSLDARTNATQLGLDNCTIITGDVGRELTILQQQENFKPPYMVMVDAPRVGLDDKAIEQLLKLNAQKILYISCNPHTQAINISRLITEGAYRIFAVQPVDQFPHTAHVENIVLMEKRD